MTDKAEEQSRLTYDQLVDQNRQLQTALEAAKAELVKKSTGETDSGI